MKITKHTINACCGRTSIIYKIDRPITKELLTKFVNLGFIEQAHLTLAGILYVENPEFILTGPFGSDRLQIKCKKSDCENKLPSLESLLLTI